MTNENTAVQALEQLGLTEYEARCYVALSRLSEGTASEVSQIAEVPRSRVYDTVDRLHKRGLVDIQQSEPRMYRAVSKETAFTKLRADFESSISTADEALEQVASAKTQEDKGVWAVANAEHVTHRAVELIDDADEHAHVIVADEIVFEQAVLDRLAAATDRGVTIVVEVPSEPVQDRVQQAIPDAHIVMTESLTESKKVVNKWPGQLIMVDQQSTLASGVEDADLPGIEETAIWTHGRDHGFAAWMPELLEDRVDVTEFE